METWELIKTYLGPAIIGSLITVIPSIVSIVKSKQIADKEIKLKELTVGKDIADGYSKLTGDLQTQIDCLNVRLEEKEKMDTIRDEEIRKLKAGVRSLIKQLKKIDPNIVPVFDVV